MKVKDKKKEEGNVKSLDKLYTRPPKPFSPPIVEPSMDERRNRPGWEQGLKHLVSDNFPEIDLKPAFGMPTVLYSSHGKRDAEQQQELQRYQKNRPAQLWNFLCKNLTDPLTQDETVPYAVKVCKERAQWCETIHMHEFAIAHNLKKGANGQIGIDDYQNAMTKVENLASYVQCPEQKEELEMTDQEKREKLARELSLISLEKKRQGTELQSLKMLNKLTQQSEGHLPLLPKASLDAYGTKKCALQKFPRRRDMIKEKYGVKSRNESKQAFDSTASTLSVARSQSLNLHAERTSSSAIKNRCYINSLRQQARIRHQTLGCGDKKDIKVRFERNRSERDFFKTMGTSMFNTGRSIYGVPQAQEAYDQYGVFGTQNRMPRNTTTLLNDIDEHTKDGLK